MEAKKNNGQALDFKSAFGILLPLCLAAVLLAGAVISVANDVYAFVKTDKQIELRIDEPLDEKALALLLQERGVVSNPFCFRLYLRSKVSPQQLSALTGEWTLNSNMSYREIILTIF